jgi:hypothetical protein
MTTAAGAALTGELSRAMSIGFENIEMQTVAVVSGDTGATVTAKALQRVDFALVCGGPVTLTAQPTYSANAVTLAFTDPAASRFLQVVLFGK